MCSVTGVIDAQQCSCWWHHRCAAALHASGIIKAQRQSSDVVAPIVLRVSMKYRGMCPLFVYYQVSVLFNKWNISDKAVTIV